MGERGEPLFDVDATNLGGSFVSISRAESYKYHACVEGAGFWSDRLGRMLFSGSVLFLQRYAAACERAIFEPGGLSRADQLMLIGSRSRTRWHHVSQSNVWQVRRLVHVGRAAMARLCATQR